MTERVAPTCRARWGLAAQAGLVALVVSGCTTAVYGGRTGHALDRAARVRIVPGTTKAELFDRLGAPLAIVGRGERADVTAAAVARPLGSGPSSEFVLQAGGTFPLDGDAALELFADRDALRPEHRVYYYACTRDTGHVLVWLVFVEETYRTRIAEGWVLVDESSERVVDAVFRDGD